MLDSLRKLKVLKNLNYFRENFRPLPNKAILAKMQMFVRFSWFRKFSQNLHRENPKRLFRFNSNYKYKYCNKMLRAWKGTGSSAGRMRLRENNRGPAPPRHPT